MDAEAILRSISSDEQALQFVEDVSKSVEEVQERVLQEILSRNAGVEYFNRHGLLGSQPSNEEFRARLPLISYSDIQADIQRMATGDFSPILSNCRLHQMLTSSGTSGGQQKLFPKSAGYYIESLLLNRIARAALNKQAPESCEGKSMQFIYVRKPGITSGGVITCSGLSGYFTSSAFRNRKVDPKTGFTSPDEVLLCVDYKQVSYCHLLCGLLQSDQVVSMGAPFASTFVRSMKTLWESWELICHDIRTGTLNTDVVTDLSVRDAMRRILKPNPGLSDFIQRECSRKSWRGIIRRLFPNAKLVQAIITGSMQQYVPIIDSLTDSLPIASPLYASSESSTLGVNLSPICSPDQVSYLAFPCFAYYEFLPVEKSDSCSHHDLVRLTEVKLEREYELVITTMGGLYRYRIGDVLRVVSLYNKAPQFAFVRRAGVVLSVDTDKTDEVELHRAVRRAFLDGIRKEEGLDEVELVDYTSRVEVGAQPGHYVVYWELSGGGASVDSVKLLECCSLLESSLSVVYQRNRREGSVGPLEMKLVKPGTFDRIVDHLVFKGQASISQYKTPRCARDTSVVHILESNVIL